MKYFKNLFHKFRELGRVKGRALFGSLQQNSWCSIEVVELNRTCRAQKDFQSIILMLIISERWHFQRTKLIQKLNTSQIVHFIEFLN